MKRIVLLRHGESQWNLENRFTGWTDVDLTEKGMGEARKAGELLKKEGFKFGMAYTSYLKRAIKTLNERGLDPRAKELALERKALRHAPRSQQERNRC